MIRNVFYHLENLGMHFYRYHATTRTLCALARVIPSLLFGTWRRPFCGQVLSGIVLSGLHTPVRDYLIGIL